MFKIIIGSFIILLILSKLKVFNINGKADKYRKNVSKDKKNQNGVIEQKDHILKYSTKKSNDLGILTSKFKESQFTRPSKIIPKVLVGANELVKATYRQKQNSNKKYVELMKSWIPVESLYEEYKEVDIKNKTLNVFVESMKGDKYKIRDNTAFYNLQLDESYGIVGKFVLINIDRKMGKVKVNEILTNNL